MFEYLCEGCGQVHWGERPPEYGDEPLPGTSKLGPGALDIALNLRYDMRLPFNKIAQHFDKHVGLKITPSGVYQMIERAARRTRSVSEEILDRALMDAWLTSPATGSGRRNSSRGRMSGSAARAGGRPCPRHAQTSYAFPCTRTTLGPTHNGHWFDETDEGSRGTERTR